MKNKKVGPFSDNPVMLGYDSRLFAYDKELGYRFPLSAVVGRHGFEDLKQVISDLKANDPEFLVLDIGDSATSGWNSDLVYKGCPDPTAALFSYKTYSDFLMEMPGVAVINAGVPGYSTHQAKKYTRALLKTLAENGLHPDYVTIYLGNNDCTFNGREDKVRIDHQAASSVEVLARVSEEDFLKNYLEIVAATREYGATPITLIPASNFKWRPGLRSKKYPEESAQPLRGIADPKLKHLLDESLRAYESGDYELALEKDVLLPRIKKSYKSKIATLAQSGVSVVDTQPFANGSENFVDYCHPGEVANARIAESIFNMLRKRNAAYEKKVVVQELPTDTYTLY